jgi:ABC-2 type transport system ATP-binding protein
LDVTQEPLETKRYIAYIPDQVTLNKNLSGLENLESFSSLAGHGEYLRDQLLKFFEEVELQREAADKRVSTYSRACDKKWE